ncbi:hypothetical protein PAE9249_01364 [Paenibacillus sp. CECT 9249]|uniref:DUF402 domain-containing protein n=1 Tax=Paenibacillus sp. CECT 9249 TaxID=2845385 RepID=UPI001E55A974|nr:DUF402 domain-containing protein [Paenibacillus sp. CECT 9249]CAH0118867.1 hypothetical protein PAE9249_01364 [Paenibacillus sp. CECT 9249]
MKTNNRYQPLTIKSFKHDGRLHRMWLENWLVPEEELGPDHTEQSMTVAINSQTPIVEADGKRWFSKVPAVTFFIPQMWFNVVVLVEDTGIRYYCNIASPPYKSDADHVITYIDYDLDVVLHPDGQVQLLDWNEYEKNRANYRYPELVVRKLMNGLEQLKLRMEGGLAPFQDEAVLRYYSAWRESQ